MIEVDFIPVGEKVKTGDAILCHFTEPVTQADRVILVDGGFTDTSDQIVEHVRKYYGRESIDLIVCTHPDDDHINGLSGVIESIQVDNLVIHRPSEHGYDQDEVKSQKVEDLVELAKSKDVKVISTVWAGQLYFNDALLIAGPTQEFYEEQLAAQTGVTAMVKAVEHAFSSAVRTIVAALRPRGDDPGEGTLSDNGGTTARNNSSIILDLRIDGNRILFTGDAGVPALSAAADLLDEFGRSDKVPDLFDVPHHGSRHNLNTATADRLLGPIVGDTQAHNAVVTVGKEADDFPRPEVANALKRRGYRVVATHGVAVWWQRGAATRSNYSAVQPFGWLEADDK